MNSKSLILGTLKLQMDGSIMCVIGSTCILMQIMGLFKSTQCAGFKVDPDSREEN